MGSSSLLVSWAITALGTYVAGDYWYLRIRPGWESTMEPKTYLASTAALGVGTALVARFIVQPFAYNFAYA